MSARPIGEIARPLFERAMGLRLFLYYLQSLPSDAARKGAILEERMRGHLDDDTTQLLIEALMLEGA